MIYAPSGHIRVKNNPLFSQRIIFIPSYFRRKCIVGFAYFIRLAVFHQFDLQIDIIVGWSYPYDHPLKSGWSLYILLHVIHKSFKYLGIFRAGKVSGGTEGIVGVTFDDAFSNCPVPSIDPNMSFIHIVHIKI